MKVDSAAAEAGRMMRTDLSVVADSAGRTGRRSEDFGQTGPGPVVAQATEPELALADSEDCWRQPGWWTVKFDSCCS